MARRYGGEKEKQKQKDKENAKNRNVERNRRTKKMPRTETESKATHGTAGQVSATNQADAARSRAPETSTGRPHRLLARCLATQSWPTLVHPAGF